MLTVHNRRKAYINNHVIQKDSNYRYYDISERFEPNNKVLEEEMELINTYYEFRGSYNHKYYRFNNSLLDEIILDDKLSEDYYNLESLWRKTNNINLNLYDRFNHDQSQIYDSDFFYIAQILGLKDFEQLLTYHEAIKNGWNTIEEYQSGLANGFEKKWDFVWAQERGFNSFDEYSEANRYDIYSYENYAKFDQIRSSLIQIVENQNFENYKDTYCYYYISNISEGTIISIENLFNDIRRSMNNDWEIENDYIPYEKEPRRPRPEQRNLLQYIDNAFEQRFINNFTRNDFENFLLKNEAIQELGHYDENRGLFRKK